jgi:hypothetical protein
MRRSQRRRGGSDQKRSQKRDVLTKPHLGKPPQISIEQVTMHLPLNKLKSIWIVNRAQVEKVALEHRNIFVAREPEQFSWECQTRTATSEDVAVPGKRSA